MREKLKYLLIIFILIHCYHLNAQHFNAGLRLGANFCQIDGDQMSGYNMAGVVGGVFVTYPFKDKWEGQFEMLFSQKGSERVIGDSSQLYGIWDVFRIDYIEVPLMINYKITKKIKLSFGLGGALMIGNHYEGKNNNVIQNNVDWIVTRGEFNGTAGAQYYFTDKFSVFSRFTYSLIGINKSGSLAAFYIYDGGLANNVLSFGINYAFLAK